MTIYTQLKTMFVLSCPRCGKRYNKHMKDKWNAGYNVVCVNCRVYIERAI